MKITRISRFFLSFFLSFLIQSNVLANDYQEDVKYTIEPRAFVLDTQIWPIDQASGYFKITVCWEDATLPTEFSTQNILTQASVSVWEMVNSCLRFLILQTIFPV